jgi:hypothetical protein
VVRFPERAKDFFLHQNVQKGSGVRTAAIQLGNAGTILGGKAVGKWIWLTPSSAEFKNEWSYNFTVLSAFMVFTGQIFITKTRHSSPHSFLFLFLCFVCFCFYLNSVSFKVTRRQWIMIREMPRTSRRAYFKNDSVWKFLGGTAYELLELGCLRSGFEIATFRVGRRWFPLGMCSVIGVPIFKEFQKKKKRLG